ncbi:hypothetical protein [Rhizobium johnstonii]|uniref:hypothetical protein n=1 Tax=Rhizobium johnstonii TaxID=3019933 RepID=UPI003F9B74F1
MSVGSILHHNDRILPQSRDDRNWRFSPPLLPALANQYLLLADFLKFLIEFAAGGWSSATQRS